MKNSAIFGLKEKWKCTFLFKKGVSREAIGSRLVFKSIVDVEYIAFGEVFFEEHSSSFKSPYLFNGKELDRETNLSFYGARYLDMKTSLWLSVDPLAEMKPNFSPYNYCSNNPINYVDPEGLTDYRVDGETTTIDDGHKGVVIDVSQRQLNRLQSKFEKGGNGYERMMNRLSSQNGYATYGATTDGGVSITTHKAGGDSYQEHQDKVFGNYSELSTRKPASGAITSMEFSSPFFSWGWAFKGVGALWGAAFDTAKGVTALRGAYVAEVEGLSSISTKMRGAGNSSEEIATVLHGLRRELGVKYKSLTPDNMLQQIYQRNIQKYGDKLGPSIDYLRQQGKSWDDIINSATRTGGKDLGF